MYQCSKKLVTCKEHCCFDHSDFPAHSMFTSDVCWGSLGTSIFGNSSSAASNTRSRLHSRLSFRFLRLWYIPIIYRIWKITTTLFLALTFLFNSFQGNKVIIKMISLQLLKFPGLLLWNVSSLLFPVTIPDFGVSTAM